VAEQTASGFGGLLRLLRAGAGLTHRSPRRPGDRLQHILARPEARAGD
jgi:hypothetical protein